MKGILAFLLQKIGSRPIVSCYGAAPLLVISATDSVVR